MRADFAFEGVPQARTDGGRGGSPWPGKSALLSAAPLGALAPGAGV